MSATTGGGGGMGTAGVEGAWLGTAGTFCELVPCVA